MCVCVWVCFSRFSLCFPDLWEERKGGKGSERSCLSSIIARSPRHALRRDRGTGDVTSELFASGRFWRHRMRTLSLSCSTFVCVSETCPLPPHKCPLTVSFGWVTAALSDAHDPPQPRCRCSPQPPPAGVLLALQVALLDRI